MFTIPFFGQFYKTCDNYTHIWSKIFYYHISGYGPPSLLITKGTVLKTTLPRIFLGYGKLLVTIVHTDSYIISSENYKNLNEQLKNSCLLVQGYGIRNSAEIRYEAFPFDSNDPITGKWAHHKGIQKLSESLNLKNTCGYVTFINTGVPDIGCENYEIDVHLTRPKLRKNSRKDSTSSAINSMSLNLNDTTKMPGHLIRVAPNASASSSSTVTTTNIPSKEITPSDEHIPDLHSPMDGSEIISYNAISLQQQKILKQIELTTSSSSSTTTQALKLKSPDEDYFAITPVNASPSNVFRSDDCNELLAKELAGLDDNSSDPDDGKFIINFLSFSINNFFTL